MCLLKTWYILGEIGTLRPQNALDLEYRPSLRGGKLYVLDRLHGLGGLKSLPYK